MITLLNWWHWEDFAGLIPDVPWRVRPLAHNMAHRSQTDQQAAGVSFFGLSGFV